jgi:hypothetical protein
MIDSADLFRLVHFFDVLAAIVFAVSAALVASRKGMDVMWLIWPAIVTGGTVRELIRGVPVFGFRIRSTCLRVSSRPSPCTSSLPYGEGPGCGLAECLPTWP